MVLDQDTQKQLNVTQEWDHRPSTKQIIMVRHLESKYNEYKGYVRKDPRYRILLDSTDPELKRQAAEGLLKEYRNDIGLDAFTNISQE